MPSVTKVACNSRSLSEAIRCPGRTLSAVCTSLPTTISASCESPCLDSARRAASMQIEVHTFTNRFLTTGQ